MYDLKLDFTLYILPMVLLVYHFVNAHLVVLSFIEKNTLFNTLLSYTEWFFNVL